ncbi:MAG: tetratricopeptide repeat protein [Desulfovibrionaceae bacterium]|jgi:predicted Zn-dependent protease|nr:tetratricopeptide repeat protein [Desulfovibrionaceae bacterium]
MSTQLIQARTKLSQVKSFLKQDKVSSAGRCVYDALVAILKSPLLKAEKEEFLRMLQDAVDSLSSNQKLKQIFPLQISIEEGKEKELLDTMKQLIDAIEEDDRKNMQALLGARDKRRKELMEKAKHLVGQGQPDEARKIFAQLTKEFYDDPSLKGEIGEIFLQAAYYEEAYEYLAAALDDSPESIHLYNRIGIALRKLGKFDVAEKYYFQAYKYAPRDPNLFFNIGRLYIDWKKWKKVEKAASKALQLKPDFVEAQKMLTFARKKQA